LPRLTKHAAPDRTDFALDYFAFRRVLFHHVFHHNFLDMHHTPTDCPPHIFRGRTEGTPRCVRIRSVGTAVPTMRDPRSQKVPGKKRLLPSRRYDPLISSASSALAPESRWVRNCRNEKKKSLPPVAAQELVGNIMRDRFHEVNNRPVEFYM
jgi:hypothetical protein